METKTVNPNLELKKESYIGLQFAQRTTQDVLRRLVNGIPIRFRMLAAGQTVRYEFRGNGMSVTILVEKQEGGAL